jgi:hypothetical protein
MSSASTPNVDTSAAWSRRGATLCSLICATVSTFSMATAGAIDRTMRVAASASPDALLSARITNPPSIENSCAKGAKATARGSASSPPSCVFATTPTIVRHASLNGVKGSTSPV